MTIEHQLFDESLRPAVIFHLATMMTDPEAIPYELEQAFEEDSDYIYKAMNVDGFFCYDDFYEIRDVLSAEGKLGFLARFETPVPEFLSGDGFVFSWGHYTSEWIYGKTYNECCKKALKWREKYIKQKRKEQNK